MQLSKTFCEVSLSMNTLVHLQNILCYSHWFVFTFLFMFAQSIRWFKLDNDEVLHLILFHVHADSRSLNIRQLLLKTFDSLKALANEDTLWQTHCCSRCFLGCANWGTFVAYTKCFLTKSETLFVPRTQILCPQQMLSAWANKETFVSATMCPRLPGA